MFYTKILAGKNLILVYIGRTQTLVYSTETWLNFMECLKSYIFKNLLSITVVHEALRHKPEGRGFDSRWCHWNFLLTSFQPHFDPGVNSACKRNEFQEHLFVGKGSRCIGLKTCSPSCANCLEIWQPQPPGNPKGLSRPVQGLQKNVFVKHITDGVSPFQ
jgi:hypothetical protein